MNWPWYTASTRANVVHRLERHLLQAGLIDEAGMQAAEDAAKDAARVFRAGMFDAPHGDPLEMFDHVFVDPTPEIIEQRASLAAELAASEGWAPVWQ